MYAYNSYTHTLVYMPSQVHVCAGTHICSDFRCHIYELYISKCTRHSLLDIFVAQIILIKAPQVSHEWQASGCLISSVENLGHSGTDSPRLCPKPFGGQELGWAQTIRLCWESPSTCITGIKVDYLVLRKTHSSPLGLVLICHFCMPPLMASMAPGLQGKAAPAAGFSGDSAHL